jgi:Cu/Ag efflux protein CusF
MPPMTMAFPVKAASMLKGLNAGDKIRFKADKAAGELTVTQIAE